jgi:O-methyltransferase
MQQKLRLFLRFRRNRDSVETLSNVREHVELAAAVLRLPKSLPGVVVECGCYVGGSSVNLSLVCELVGRRLIVCDSFQGLPEPSEQDRLHANLHSGHVDEYYEGRFAAPIELVRGNISRHGAVGVCELVPGFFDDTLADLDSEVVLAFLDVDLIESLRPCITGLWPKLQDGCRVYVHEARSLSLVAIFFDAGWWQEQLGEVAPGFVGAGTGLPLAAEYGSELGYAQKGSYAAGTQLAASCD